MMQKDLNQKRKTTAKRDNTEFQLLMMKLITEESMRVPGIGIGQFRFPVYISERLKEQPIEVLELNERGYNCLRRVGYKTMYELLDKNSCMQDFGKIRGCGSGTAREIMEKIFIYQYNALAPEKRQNFIKRINEMNKDSYRALND